MRKLELNQMEVLIGGAECYSCGQAILMGAMIGGWFGGFGALVGVAMAALGENCLNAGDTNFCDN